MKHGIEIITDMKQVLEEFGFYTFLGHAKNLESGDGWYYIGVAEDSKSDISAYLNEMDSLKQLREKMAELLSSHDNLMMESTIKGILSIKKVFEDLGYYVFLEHAVDDNTDKSWYYIGVCESVVTDALECFNELDTETEIKSTMVKMLQYS